MPHSVFFTKLFQVRSTFYLNGLPSESGGEVGKSTRSDVGCSKCPYFFHGFLTGGTKVCSIHPMYIDFLFPPALTGEVIDGHQQLHPVEDLWFSRRVSLLVVPAVFVVVSPQVVGG